MKKDIIIIGGGISGLSAGCYSAMNNYKTTIFDINSNYGGLLASWVRSAFKFDGSISFLYGNKPNSFFYDAFKELKISDPDLYVDLNELNYAFPNGSISITQNLEQLRIDLIKISPKNNDEINMLIEDIKLMVNTTLSKNGTPQFDKKFFSLKYLQTAESYISSLKDDNLNFIFRNLFCSSLPFNVILWFLGRFINNELSYTRHGSHVISQRLANHFNELGGSIQHNKEVSKIITDKNRAIGVELLNGEKHYSDYIICASDYYSVFYNLLENKYTTKSIVNQFANWDLFDGIVLISLGINKQFNHLPFYNNIMLKSPVSVLGTDIQEIHLKNFGHLEGFAPKGRSVVQVVFFSEFNAWKDLRDDAEQYYSQKQSIANKFIKELDHYLPGLKDSVEEIDVSTPYTFWRYSRNYKGAYEGWLPTIKNISQNLPIKIPDLEGIYLAGQWLKPGGGVGPSILTGKQAVEQLCKDEKKEFKTQAYSLH